MLLWKVLWKFCSLVGSINHGYCHGPDVQIRIWRAGAVAGWWSVYLCMLQEGLHRVHNNLSLMKFRVDYIGTASFMHYSSDKYNRRLHRWLWVCYVYFQEAILTGLSARRNRNICYHYSIFIEYLSVGVLLFPLYANTYARGDNCLPLSS